MRAMTRKAEHRQLIVWCIDFAIKGLITSAAMLGTIYACSFVVEAAAKFI